LLSSLFVHLELSLLRLNIVVLVFKSWALIQGAVTLFADESCLALVDRLFTILMHKLDILTLHVLINDLFDNGILEGASKHQVISVKEFVILPKKFGQLGLDSVKDATNLTSGNLGGNLKRGILLPAISLLLDRMLSDLL
jgi:hypothetical protein